MRKKYEKPLTAKELAERPDTEIDYSDVAELDSDFWKQATIEPPRSKQQISLRLPKAVIDYFKARNPTGYTSRMAAVLAAYVSAHEGEKER